MEGQWTFSALDIEWSNDVYDTKEQAVEVAKALFDDGLFDGGCIVGQLEHDYGINYKIINQEKIMFS